MYDNILIPTDGSEGTELAMDHALDLAETYDATVHALFVVDTGYLYSGIEDSPVNWDAVLSELEEDGKRAVNDAFEQAADRGIDLNRELLQSSNIHKAILEYAGENDVDLIVMGTHGRTGFDRYLLGSVTEKVVRTSKIPVLTVPMRGSD